MKKHKRGYGWRPDKPDFRDYKFVPPKELWEGPLPPSVDLRPDCPPILDQGQLGSCTANAIAEAIEFDRRKQNLTRWVPSRLFIYYNERVMEGTVKEDAGAEIRDGIKSIAHEGAPPESYWPYTVSKFANKPAKRAFLAAVKHKAVTYRRVNQTLTDIRACLAAGFPFVGGFAVYESFESPEVEKTGTVPMPSKDEAQLGGHAVLFVGYDDSARIFRAQNSWGPDWGDKGFFTLPYDYLTDNNLADDFWQISVVQ